MSTSVTEVADGIYRIATFVPDYNISFNQFVIDDDEPVLVHTGNYQDYELVRQGVARVLDPARLKHIVLLHFEADECGGMQRFADAAPGSQLVCSELSAMLNLKGWDFRGAVKGMRDGTVLETGRHRLRFLETPHVHHWDSMMVFDETTRSLFPSDLFIQPGEQPALVNEDLGREMCGLYRAIGIFAAEEPVRRVADRLESLQPDRIHAMHGGTLTAEIAPRYFRALRENDFAFDGRVFGRMLPQGDAAAAIG